MERAWTGSSLCRGSGSHLEQTEEIRRFARDGMYSSVLTFIRLSPRDVQLVPFCIAECWHHPASAVVGPPSACFDPAAKPWTPRVPAFLLVLLVIALPFT